MVGKERSDDMKRALMLILIVLTVGLLSGCGNHNMYYDDPNYQYPSAEEETTDSGADAAAETEENTADQSDDIEAQRQEEVPPQEEINGYQSESSDNDLAEKYGY